MSLADDVASLTTATASALGAKIPSTSLLEAHAAAINAAAPATATPSHEFVVSTHNAYVAQFDAFTDAFKAQRGIVAAVAADSAPGIAPLSPADLGSIAANPWLYYCIAVSILANVHYALPADQSAAQAASLAKFLVDDITTFNTRVALGQPAPPLTPDMVGLTVTSMPSPEQLAAMLLQFQMGFQ